jgi:hypothetical protein
MAKEEHCAQPPQQPERLYTQVPHHSHKGGSHLVTAGDN